MESREDWKTDGRINSNCVGEWERPIREGKFNNAGEGGEMARVVSSNRQEEMRASM